MSEGKHVKKRIRILVKAFPQPSQKHEETVCCAGITEDGQELLRLFPIRYRRLDKEEQFDRFDLVEMTITKASDPRPESYRVDEGSIADRHGRLKAEAVSPRKPRGETVYPTCVSARGDTKLASERGVESSRELATESQRAKRCCDVVPVTGTAGAQ